MRIVVKMSVERRVEDEEARYPRSETLAEFELDANGARAIQVFQDALAALVSPSAVIVTEEQ